ncbi:MAG: SulP family inorganic anion transporter [Elainellaceae cyanobacterium]
MSLSRGIPLRRITKLLLNTSITFSTLGVFVQPDEVLKWLPSFGFAIILLGLLQRIRHISVLPICVMSAIALFYTVLFWTHTSIAEAQSGGWLLGPFSHGQLWRPLALVDVRQADWSLIVSQISCIVAIMLLSTFSLLLNSIGLEVLTDKHLNLKREMQVVGIANLASGFAGGVVGSHSLKSSFLAYRMSGRSRIVGLAAAGVFAVVFAFGTSLLSMFPRPILGGLLLYLGLTLLVEWVYDAYFKLPTTEYAMIVFILTVIAVAGFLPGIGAGLVVAALTFVVKYSRVDTARRIYSGTQRKSNVERSRAHEKVLARYGEQIYILELQGFIFFGTANNLLNLIRQRLDASDLQPLKFIVFDFRLVNGLDASAILNFNKIKKLASQNQVHIVVTALTPETRQILQQGGCLSKDDPTLLTLPDLDRGVEWCENRLLAMHVDEVTSLPSITAQFDEIFPGSDQVSLFRNYLTAIQVAQGDIVFQQGNPSDGVYFVAAGQVSLLLEKSGGRNRRLRAFGPGAIIGEMGIYNQTVRSASLVADSPSRLYHLSARFLSHMEKEAPELATRLHKVIIQVLSERLIDVKHNSSTLSSRPIAPYDIAPHSVERPANQHPMPAILPSNDWQAIAELWMHGQFSSRRGVRKISVCNPAADC